MTVLKILQVEKECLGPGTGFLFKLHFTLYTFHSGFARTSAAQPKATNFDPSPGTA